MRSNCRAWHKVRHVQEGRGGPGTTSLLRKTLFGDPGYPGGRWVLTALRGCYLPTLCQLWESGTILNI